MDPYDSNALNSPLLRLPTELKDMIYRFALLEPEDISVDFHFWEPGLLQACLCIGKEWHGGVLKV
ncbi:hypothetical protein PRZ48_012594 [Zasmidium cellare]|uniref:F-box domain-containing protein n=1 Tax=Zasmidium cellare TaxID=395010 RepID=A0ABR0E5B4_ZASCE|nr:hypothetical protein PRZ48_012594 [Zasmidium cellare]